ncbi:MAG: phosphate ABC transporter permease PstA [Euryarchaeota archaeon]|nr:MAG: phosphate transport system permease protein [ANME-2 cluster archaeon]MEA1866055.1 phosphate ABC transporter permease PstA [Euryarchaeota archaeon]
MTALISPVTADKAAKVALWVSAGIALLILAVILGYIVVQGVHVITLSFLLESPRLSGAEGGILPAIVGTFWLMMVAMLSSVPIGIGAAVYLAEYAPKSAVTAVISFGVECLAGVPSIVIGLFGYAFLSIYLGFGFSVLSGGLALMFMVLPWIVRVSEESIKTVPNAFREASLALGATKWQTVRRVVLPSAIPGITTGVILGIGKAIGETAVIMFTAGSSLLMPMSLFDPVRALPYHIYILASEGISNPMAYGSSIVLLVMVLAINLAAITIQRHYGRHYVRN